MTYRKITPKRDDKDVWKPEAGEQLEGKLINIQENIGPNDSMMYTIETTEGEKKIWGSVSLDLRLREVEVGSNVLIEFKGLQVNPGTGREYKSFEVSIDEE